MVFFFKDEGAYYDYTSRVVVKVLKAKIVTKNNRKESALKKNSPQ